ncbi:sensor histidine kinase [Lentisalinibacter sediminis]|uniref:sensor histidine kinase n=1 Tax=Lentisalinibacter sediminis TaxID=2992237 RepID=UPI00386E3364
METAEEQAHGSDCHRKGRGKEQAPQPGGTPTSRPVPEIVFLLDADGRIVRWTAPHPGPRLGELNLLAGMSIHDALHPGCRKERCRLTASFSDAWATHLSGLPVEWLFASNTLEGVLKLRLQPVAYACGEFFGEAVACHAAHSVLFMLDITVGYRAAERDDNPGWQAVREIPEPVPMVERFLPVGSPVLEPAPDARLTSLTAQLLVAQEAEQKRLAAELHDGLGQSLSLLRFEIDGGIAKQADRDCAIRTLERAAEYVRRSQEELRRITSNLGPVSLKKYGLIGSLDLLCKELRAACPGIGVRCVLDGTEQIVPGDLAVAVYRIAQEAMNNVATHAGAASLTLEFRTPEGGVELRVVDDGVGLPLDGECREGLGLTTMRERAEFLGGRFSLISAPLEGCEVRVSWSAAAVRLLG